MTVEIYFYLLMIICLLFLIILVRRSPYIHHQKNMFVQHTAYANILILLCYIGRSIVSVSPSFMMANLIEVVIFIPATAIPYFLLMASKKQFGLKEWLTFIPSGIITILAISSPVTGAMFHISDDSKYTMGPLFFLACLVFLFYFIYWIINSFREYPYMEPNEILYETLLFIFIVVCVFIQFMDHNIPSIWTGSALAILLYYFISIEFSGKCDILTGLRNRTSYDTRVRSLTHEEAYTIIIFNANRLKETNDYLGHEEGDKFLTVIAQVTSRVFRRYGIGYRIGGDEFCFICKGVLDENLITEKLGKVDRLLLQKSNPEYMIFSVAHGFATHEAFVPELFEDVFQKAYNDMYKSKRKFYQTFHTGATERQSAVDILFDSYFQIIAINLVKDEFRIIKTNIPISKETCKDDFRVTLWISRYLDSGLILESDRDNFKRLTDLEFLKSHFYAGNPSLSIHFSRLVKGKLTPATVDLIPARNFGPDNPIVYVYIKNT